MIRKTMTMVAALLVAVCALGAAAEAAPGKVRPRAKHSSRVASGSTATRRPVAKKRSSKRRTQAARKPATHHAAKGKSATKPR